MMPHMWWLSLFLLLDPAVDVALLAGTDCEGARRHVLADGRAGSHVRVPRHRDRRDELRVAADERAVLDDGLVLAGAVVVAGDRAGADVHLLADRRVAEVGQVFRLRSLAEHGLLQLG